MSAGGSPAEQDIHQHAPSAAEVHEDRVRQLFPFRRNGRIVHQHAGDYRFPGHPPPCLLQVVQIPLVEAGVRLSPVGAVREVFPEIPAADTGLPRLRCRVLPVLQRQRPVAVPAGHPVRRIIGIRQRAFHKYDRRVRLLRASGPDEPRAAVETGQRVHGLSRLRQADKVLVRTDRPLRNVHPDPFLQRQASGPQEHRAPGLGVQSFLYKSGVSDNPLALCRIQVGILEKAHPEHTLQQPLRAQAHPFVHECRAEPLLADPPGLQHRFGPVVSAELIHPVQDDPQVALRLRQFVHAVAPASEAVDLRIRISRDPPVGADHAVIGVFPAEQLLQDPSVKGRICCSNCPPGYTAKHPYA